MEVSDKISILAQRVAKLKDGVETEEATKNAFIMPFLQALGYDVFDPGVVIPEFTADVGTKKGEKVDYAIRTNGSISIIIECKSSREILSSNHTNQLFRYFTVTEARFGLLTNGINYWFYTDLDESNKMDSKPFFEFDILNYRASQIEELQKFSAEAFDVATILETASDLKYGSAIMKEFSNEIEMPSEELKRLLVARIYEGKLTSNVMQKFSPLIARAIKDTIREIVNQRLSSAIDDTIKVQSPPVGSSEVRQEKTSETIELPGAEEIVTTQEEIDAFLIIRAIGRSVTNVNNIIMRDSKSYCAILFQDNNRKPICRLHLNRSIKYIGLFDANKAETRSKIETIDDIYNFENTIRETINRYVGANGE